MSTEDLYYDDVETLEDSDDVADEADNRETVQPPSESLHDDAPYAVGEPSGQAESPGFQSLALDLTLRCGELKLTLGELQRLSAGSILEISGVAPGHATLCHGEHVVAEGELVDVDGRLGLEITRLATRS